MKNKIKLTALILSLLTLFGCAENNSTSSGESSLQNSEVSSTDSNSLVSEDELSSTTDENKEQFLKAPEGADGFVYDRDTFRFTTVDVDVGILGLLDGHTTTPLACDKFIEKCKKNDFICVKVSIAGESFEVFNGMMLGETDTPFGNENVGGVFTPVLIEEIVDTFDNKAAVNKGDIIYLRESYNRVTDNVIKWEEEKLAKDKSDFENGKEPEQYFFEIREQIIDYYKAHTEDNSLILYQVYPMELNKSYLVLMNNEKVENLLDMDAHENWGYFLNLGDSAPDSYIGVDWVLYYYYQYETLWKGCKELYGSYFE